MRMRAMVMRMVMVMLLVLCDDGVCSTREGWLLLRMRAMVMVMMHRHHRVQHHGPGLCLHVLGCWWW